MTGARVQRAGTPDQIAALQADWLGLMRDAVSPSIFLRPEWHLAWLRHLRRSERPCVCTVFLDDRLVGLVPLTFGTRLIAGVPVRILSHMLNGFADYTENLSAKGAADCFIAVLEDLRKDLRWDVVTYQDVPAGSAMMALLPELTARWSVVAVRSGICPYIPVGRSWDEHIADTLKGSKERRREYKRKARNFLQLEGLDFISEEDIRSGRISLDALGELEKATWKGRESVGLLCEAGSPRCAFYRDVFEALLKADAISCEGVTMAGRLIAFLLGFRDTEKVYAYATAFDPALADANPGFSVYVRLAQRAFRDKAAEFDMLRGPTRYKNLISGRARQNYRLFVFRTRAMALLFARYLRLRQRIKRMLGRRDAIKWAWRGDVETAAWDSGEEFRLIEPHTLGR